jgi:hypothetical protein
MIFEIEVKPACPVRFRILGAIEKIIEMQMTTAMIAAMIARSLLIFPSFSIDMLMSNDMEPGPDNSGIAKGLKDISSFISDSSFIFSLTSSLCCAFNNKKPERDIIIPPAILSELIEIPKKLRICVPIK